MASESNQHKLDRVRPPRVQITYDVETEGSIQKKELPFVVGVIADLSGKPETPLPKLKDRKFVDVDRDNFDDVLKGMNPRVTLSVENRLQNDNSKLAVELKFSSMEDFEPQKLVEQVEPLRKLMEARDKLNQLLIRLDGNDRGMEALESIIHDTEKLHQLKQQSDTARAKSAIDSKKT